MSCWIYSWEIAFIGCAITVGSEASQYRCFRSFQKKGLPTYDFYSSTDGILRRWFRRRWLTYKSGLNIRNLSRIETLTIYIIICCDLNNGIICSEYIFFLILNVVTFVPAGGCWKVLSGERGMINIGCGNRRSITNMNMSTSAAMEFPPRKGYCYRNHLSIGLEFG